MLIFEIKKWGNTTSYFKSVDIKQWRENFDTYFLAPTLWLQSEISNAFRSVPLLSLSSSCLAPPSRRAHNLLPWTSSHPSQTADVALAQALDRPEKQESISLEIPLTVMGECYRLNAWAFSTGKGNLEPWSVRMDEWDQGLNPSDMCYVENSRDGI